MPPSGGQSQSTQPPDSGQQGQTPEPKVFKRQLKMNGEEREVEASEEDLWNAYRHVESINQRARQLAEEKKAAEQQRREWEAKQKALLEDPLALHREQDPNFDEVDFLTQQLHRRLERQAMDPRQRALLEREERLAAREAQIQSMEEQRRAEMEQQQERQQLSQLGERFVRALQKTNLPKDDLTLNAMYQAHVTNEENGLELNDEELGKATFDAIVTQQRSVLSQLKGEALLDTFPEFSRAVHEALVARFKARQGQQTIQQNAPPPPQQPVIQERKTEAELQRELEAKTGRRVMRTI